MGYEQITFVSEGPVGIITLNRPEKRNAWSSQMQRELYAAVSACNADPACRVIVIRGEGTDYCAGADLDAAAERIQSRERGDPVRLEGAPGAETASIPDLFPASLPIICAIHGRAIGVGATHTLLADVRIASENARFGLTFVRVGLVPEFRSSFYLPQHAGLGNAMRWLLSGELMSAQEAYRIGLVAEVVPGDRLLGVALDLARTIAANPREHLLWTKRLVYANAVQHDANAVREVEERYMAQARTSEAHKEAVRSFLERRQQRPSGSA